MSKFNLDEYETVETRLERFWLRYPEGRIHTHVLHRDDKTFIVQAMLFRTSDPMEEPFSSGMAEEIVGSTPVNKTSALENCETSAIGRALANGGFAAKGKRPSREEMVKVVSRNEFDADGLAARIAKTQTAEELKVLWGQVPLEATLGDGRTVKDAILDRVKEIKTAQEESE